jgi:hypothetical protein
MNNSAWTCTFTPEKWDPEYKKKCSADMVYLKPATWADGLTLPIPPAVDVAKDCSDLDGIVKLRKKEQEPLITWQAYSDQRAVWAVQEVHGEAKLANRLMVEALLNDIQRPIFELKFAHNRGRPRRCCKQVMNRMFEPPSSYYPAHPSYPSGHATMAYAVAYLLSEIDPAKAGDFVRAAKSVAYNRELAGVHYPSDSEAGRILAKHLVGKLLAEPDFKDLVKATCVEWGAAGPACQP